MISPSQPASHKPLLFCRKFPLYPESQPLTFGINRFIALNVQSDRLSRQGLYKDLHGPSNEDEDTKWRVAKDSWVL